MKPSRRSWIESRWPLIEKGMSRADCAEWLGPDLTPQKSACVFCPFHDDRTWAEMRLNAPDVFAEAVEFDTDIRQGKLGGVRADAYLHSSLTPLAEVDFGNDTTDQLNLQFGNECEGMCGV